VSGFLRQKLWLSLSAAAAALAFAGSASATPLRPAISSLPLVQISDPAARAGLQTRTCGGLLCYTPAFLAQAYDFPNGNGAPTGAGQTIVVVVAYGSPTIRDDLAAFDAENGLPAPPGFAEIHQATPGSPNGSGQLALWGQETSLDVEYAHATAPGANIVLAVAATDDSADIAEIEHEVLPLYPGAVVTQSFGADENLFFDPDFGDPASALVMQGLYRDEVRSGGTIVVASGDLGATDDTIFFGQPTPVATFPASSPLVLAVGGTEGGQGSAPPLWNNGRYGSEQVWNEPWLTPLPGASGGGVSNIFPAQPLQTALTGSQQRMEPDVAYNAAVNGGVIINWTSPFGTHHALMGGTSAAAPQWAGIIALANELRGRQGKLPLGLATPQLYTLAGDRNAYRQDFHDITVGNNALGGDPNRLPGFYAGPGYDLPTGLGTPDVARLIKDLADRDGLRLRLDDLVVSRPAGHGHHFGVRAGG
jgi:subtilase family serine protease